MCPGHFRHGKLPVQCLKLSMHPAPGVHIFRAGCTIFKAVHPDCAHFFSHLSSLHIRRVQGKVPGCTDSRGVHPAGAQSKSLISDTAVVHIASNRINGLDFPNRRQKDVKIIELYEDRGVGQGWAKNVTVESKNSCHRIVKRKASGLGPTSIRVTTHRETCMSTIMAA